MKFSLIQLLLAVTIILIIAFLVLTNYKPTNTKYSVPDHPMITIPFQQIKIGK